MGNNHSFLIELRVLIPSTSYIVSTFCFATYVALDVVKETQLFTITRKHLFYLKYSQIFGQMILCHLSQKNTCHVTRYNDYINK